MRLEVVLGGRRHRSADTEYDCVNVLSLGMSVCVSVLHAIPNLTRTLASHTSCSCAGPASAPLRRRAAPLLGGPRSLSPVAGSHAPPPLHAAAVLPRLVHPWRVIFLRAVVQRMDLPGSELWSLWAGPWL